MADKDMDMEIPGGKEAPEGPTASIFKGDLESAFDSIREQTCESTRLRDESIRELLSEIRNELFPIVDPEQIEEDKEVPLEVLEKMSELGLFALKVDEDDGGKGLGQYGYNKVLALLGSYSSALAAYTSAHNSLGAIYPLLHYGTDEQKERLLPEVTSWPTGFCFTEREVGSDPASMRAFAVRVRDDETDELVGYRLNAKKWYTTNSLRADYLAVVANAVDEPPAEGEVPDKNFCVFLVSTDSEGVTIGEPNEFAGMFGIDNANPEFDDVFVPVENRIGDEGQGFNIALEALNAGRISVAAITTASAKQAFAISKWWANNRDQMGLIGKHELVQDKLVRMVAETYAMESLVDFAALRSDKGLDSSLEASIAKVFATEIGWQCIDDMMQVRGGRGYETHNSLSDRDSAPPVERIWRDLRVARIFEGTTEVLTLWTVARGLHPYMKIGMKAMKGNLFDKALAGVDMVGRFFGSFRSKLSKRHHFSIDLEDHVEYAEEAARRLVRVIVFSSVRYQSKLQFKQLLVERMFWIAARILTIALVCDRGSRGGGDELSLADTYCNLARQEIERLFDEVSDNADEVIRPSAKEALDGSFDFLKNQVFMPDSVS